MFESDPKRNERILGIVAIIGAVLFVVWPPWTLRLVIDLAEKRRPLLMFVVMVWFFMQISTIPAIVFAGLM